MRLAMLLLNHAMSSKGLHASLLLRGRADKTCRCTASSGTQQNQHKPVSRRHGLVKAGIELRPSVHQHCAPAPARRASWASAATRVLLGCCSAPVPQEGEQSKEVKGPVDKRRASEGPPAHVSCPGHGDDPGHCAKAHMHNASTCQRCAGRGAQGLAHQPRCRADAAHVRCPRQSAGLGVLVRPLQAHDGAVGGGVAVADAVRLVQDNPAACCPVRAGRRTAPAAQSQAAEGYKVNLPCSPSAHWPLQTHGTAPCGLIGLQRNMAAEADAHLCHLMRETGPGVRARASCTTTSYVEITRSAVASTSVPMLCLAPSQCRSVGCAAIASCWLCPWHVVPVAIQQPGGCILGTEVDSSWLSARAAAAMAG